MKSLSEEMLFRGMRGVADKKPSEMSKSELSHAISSLDKDERYIFEERLGILCGAGQPTIEQIDIAWSDVIRARIERAMTGEF